jgi:hypothetical protein
MDDEMFASLSRGISAPKSAVLVEEVKPQVVVVKKTTSWLPLLLGIPVLIFGTLIVWRRRAKSSYDGRTLPGIEQVPRAPILPVMPLKPDPVYEAPTEHHHKPVDDIVQVDGPLPTWSAEEVYDGPEQRVGDSDAHVLDLVKAREAFTKDMEAEMQRAMKGGSS